MKYYNIIAFCLFTIIFIKSPAQYYYGENGYGKLNIVNDSVMRAFFIDHYEHDKGSFTDIIYSRNGDTLFLTSRYKQSAIFDTLISMSEVFEPTSNFSPVIMKVYYKFDYFDSLILGSKSLMDTINYYLGYEEIAYWDRNRNNVICFLDNPSRECIIVLRIAATYIRVNVPSVIKKTEKKKNYYAIIDISGSFSYGHMISLDKFPLLVRDDSLYPIDSSKNFQCWIDNGFFFPVMKKGLPKGQFKYSNAVWNKGLTNLRGLFFFQIIK